MLDNLDVRVETTDRLEASDLDAVTALVEAVTEADGLHPLSEHVMLHLRLGGEGPARHLLVFAAEPQEQAPKSKHPDHAAGGPTERLAAYAHLDPTDEVEGPSAEILVHPDLRRHGIGRLLVRSLERASPDGRLRLWAHGQLAGARALAAMLGYESSRELWQMRRSLYAPLPPIELPAGFRLRAFEPGRDDRAWLDVNAAAFADHPEQGTWTLDDLHRRIGEPWFDAAGFLVLQAPNGDIAGFHWTKVHGGHKHAGHAHDPIGEVYVVGVAPAHQGRRLGRALTLAGLRHLRQRGLAQAMLYVDADNPAAIRTYTSLGFTRWDVDAMFTRPAVSPGRATRDALDGDTIQG